jgi:hypothetical protein
METRKEIQNAKSKIQNTGIEKLTSLHAGKQVHKFTSSPIHQFTTSYVPPG